MEKNNNSKSSSTAFANQGLLSLPEHVLTILTDFLAFETAQTLALVSRALYRPARYRTLRNLTIDLKASNFEPIRKRLQELEAEDWLPAVRKLTVLDHDHNWLYSNRRHVVSAESGSTDGVEDVCRVLRASTGLLLLDWKGKFIPRPVLECLKTCSQVKLSARVHENRQRHLKALTASNDTLLHRLQQNHSLHALDISIMYTRADECRAFLRVLKKTLLTSPNLRKLRLDVHMPFGGCVVYDVPEEHHGFDFVGDEKLPPLEGLDLVSYPFRVEPETAEDEASPRYAAEAHEEVFWAERFNWSRLRCLNAFPCTFVDNLMPRLTALQELTFYRGGPFNNFFLQNVPAGLQTISMRYDTRLGVSGPMLHSKTLKRLVLHGFEDSTRPWNMNCIDSEGLRLVGCACTGLEELEIDVERSIGHWPYDLLDQVVHFTALRKLTIWFSLSEGPKLQEPYITFSAATMLFQYLRDRGMRAIELIVHSGAPRPKPNSELLEDPDWKREMSKTFRCALAEKDWDAAAGIFTTTCLETDDEANEWMRAQVGQASTSSEDRRRLEFEEFKEGMVSALSTAAQQAFRVAWFGPITAEEWEEDTGYV